MSQEIIKKGNQLVADLYKYKYAKEYALQSINEFIKDRGLPELAPEEIGKICNCADIHLIELQKQWDAFQQPLNACCEKVSVESVKAKAELKRSLDFQTNIHISCIMIERFPPIWSKLKKKLKAPIAYPMLNTIQLAVLLGSTYDSVTTAHPIVDELRTIHNDLVAQGFDNKAVILIIEQYIDKMEIPAKYDKRPPKIPERGVNIS